MLEKAIVENFRSHKKTIVKFSPGLNIFIGESDTGKTAFMAGLWWNFRNQPYGDSFRSDWGGDTRVITFFSNTPKIQRVRTNKENYYKISGLTKFDALGKGGIPEKVSKIINIGDINIQYHTDPSYLFNSSPPEVARYINQLIDLEIISSTLSNIDSEKRSLDGVLKTELAEQDKIKKALKNYKWIDKAEHSLKILEQLSRDVQTLTADRREAKKIFSLILDNKKELKKLEQILSAKKEVKALLTLEKQINKDEKQLKQATTLFNSLSNKNDQVKLLRANIKKMRKNLPSICPFCKQPIRRKK